MPKFMPIHPAIRHHARRLSRGGQFALGSLGAGAAGGFSWAMGDHLFQTVKPMIRKLRLARKIRRAWSVASKLPEPPIG